MSWTQIIGYDREKKILQKAISEHRVASAYCFTGLEGVGKDAVAIQFAKTLNCESPVKNGDMLDSCDSCESCRKIKNFSHQNFKFIYALPSAKKVDAKGSDPIENMSDEQLEEIKSELTNKQNNHYHKIAISNANQIRINSIRFLKKSLTLSDSGRGRRVVLVSEADNMTDEAANSFLKTLEEPHSNITIILTTSNPNKLLPTILSRCQLIKFGPLSNELIAKALIQRDGFAADDAMLASAFGQGSYRKALNSADKEMKSRRESMIDMLRTVVKKKFRLDLISKIEALIKENDKNKLHTSLMLFHLWMRDAYLISLNGNKNRIVNADQIDVIKKFVNYYDTVDFSMIINEIEKASASIYRNVNQQLIFLRLFMKIKEILMLK